MKKIALILAIFFLIISVPAFADDPAPGSSDSGNPIESGGDSDSGSSGGDSTPPSGGDSGSSGGDSGSSGGDSGSSGGNSGSSGGNSGSSGGDSGSSGGDSGSSGGDSGSSGDDSGSSGGDSGSSDGDSTPPSGGSETQPPENPPTSNPTADATQVPAANPTSAPSIPPSETNTPSETPANPSVPGETPPADGTASPDETIFPGGVIPGIPEFPEVSEDPSIWETPAPTEEPVNLYRITVSALKTMPAPDYSDPFSWYKAGGSNDRDVDVFFLLPTCWSRRGGQPLVGEADPDTMQVRADYAYDSGISLFEQYTNIYIPYYRQIDSNYAMRQSVQYVQDLLMLASVDDVIAALDYYFANLNDGRPYILAGHSQGSQLLTYVLGVYMKEHPEYYERMIAAYAVGYSVTESYIAENPHLKFAEGADDTGVILSWNTEAGGVTQRNPVILEGALVINPITWTRSEKPALPVQSRGSMINGMKMMRFADAQVDPVRGCIICSTVDPELYSTNRSFPFGTYHSWDYAFYYYDIQENVRVRIESWFNQNS